MCLSALHEDLVFFYFFIVQLCEMKGDLKAVFTLQSRRNVQIRVRLHGVAC